MDWSEPVVRRLSECRSWAYHGQRPRATEPAALAALALLGHEPPEAARAALDWLASIQSSDGSIGIFEDQTAPHWPTSQAVLAWQLAQQTADVGNRYQRAIDRAVRFTLQLAGVTLDPTPELGHNPQLVGWPWIETTHSWQEPTCWAVLALRATGQGDHERTREGIRLLVDRLLPTGGCNYGNTFVLSQELRPHVQPTGICLLALAGESIEDPRVGKSIDYLLDAVDDQTTTASLCYAVVGLAAQGRTLPKADELLAATAERVLRRDANAHHLALLALAALGSDCPLLPAAARSNGG